MRLKEIIIRLGLMLITVLMLSAFASIPRAFAQTQMVNVYLFEGEGCPYCEQAYNYLTALAEENPRIVVHDFEVYHIPENQALFQEFGEAYGMQPRVVPTTFIANRYWEGFGPNIQAEMDTVIERSLAAPHTDKGRAILPDSFFEEQEIITEPPADNDESPPPAGQSITLPLIGTIDLSRHSLLFSTLIISFVDGFNPCSLWVLSILLSITLQSGSRKNVLIVGSTFLFVTAALYGVFIAGIFSVLRVFQFMGWIQVLVALIALVFALVNIKDYFWFKEGISFTISDNKKPGIFKRMRQLLEHSDSPWRLIGATIVFAAGIALVELSCTAGFPVIWSNIVASQNVTTTTFVLLLLVYMLVYLLDEMGIFLVAVFTLRSSKLEEKHGRVLKLIGGMLMLSLAVVMLIDPSLMNDIASSLLVFAVAFGLSGLVLLVHRVILPKLNIQVRS